MIRYILKPSLAAIALFFSFHTFGQSFVGSVSRGNDVIDIYNNPAFAINNDNCQINAAGVSFLCGTNAYTFTKSNITSLNGTLGNDFVKNNNNADKAVWANIDVHGPAISFKIKKKYFVAVSTRARYLINADHLSSTAFQLVDGHPADTNALSLHNFSGSAQVFSELNLMYAGYICNTEDYQLTGGIALKVLMGAGALAFGMPDAQVNTREQYPLNGIQGSAHVAFTPYANRWMSFGAPYLAFPNTLYNMGLGLDMGLVYTFTPNNTMHRNKDGYVTRIAISITDIGSINYTASTTTGSYVANKASVADFNLLSRDPNTTYGANIYRLVTDSSIRQTSASSRFKMGLPTALHINGDFKCMDKFYLNTYFLLNLRKPSADKFASHYISTFIFAPRLQYTSWSVGCPFSYNTYGNANIGISVNAGPLYIGSSTLLSTMAEGSISNIDIYAGIAIRLKDKNENSLYE